MLSDIELAHQLDYDDIPVGINYCTNNGELVGAQTVWGRYDSLAESYMRDFNFGFEHGSGPSNTANTCDGILWQNSVVQNIGFWLSNDENSYVQGINLSLSNGESYELGKVNSPNQRDF